MVVIISITIYLLIGAMIGLKDSELIEESFNEAEEEYKTQGGFSKFEQAVALLLIVLVAPMVEVVAGIRNLIQ